MEYDFRKIEQDWQQQWQSKTCFFIFFQRKKIKESLLYIISLLINEPRSCYLILTPCYSYLATCYIHLAAYISCFFCTRHFYLSSTSVASHSCTLFLY